MSLKELDTENADRDITSLITVLIHTPTINSTCIGLIKLGDGTKNLDGTGGDFQLVITVGGQTVQPSPQTITFSTAVRGMVWTTPFPVVANDEVIMRVVSPNGADTDVDCTASLYDTTFALPAAADAAAGGLPISDAGDLDLDVKLANTNEITAARMGALTDWINGGRLDLLLDAIPTTAMRGTDSANTTTPPTVEAIADQVWDEILTGATHNIATSAGRRLRDITSPVLISGTSPDSGGTANTSIRIELDGDASAVDGTYDPGEICITEGTGAGQSRQIWEYDGTNKYVYVNRDWKIIPDNTSKYTIYASAGNTHVNEGLAEGGDTNKITLNSLASSVDDAYNGQTAFIAAGVGADQALRIIAYNGTTKVATVSRNWVTQPNTGSIYAVLPITDLLNDLSADDINEQMLDVITVDTFPEPGQEAPSATPTFEEMVHFLYKAFRNKKVQDSSTYELYNDAGDTVDQKGADSDDGTDATVGEIISGP